MCVSVYTQRDVPPFGHRAGGCTFQLEGHAVTAGRLGTANAQGSFWRTARITMDVATPRTGIRSTHPVVSLFRPIQRLPWNPKIKQDSEEGHGCGCFSAELLRIYLLCSSGSNCPRVSKGQDWNEVFVKMVGFCLTPILNLFCSKLLQLVESSLVAYLRDQELSTPRVGPTLPPKSQKRPRSSPDGGQVRLAIITPVDRPAHEAPQSKPASRSTGQPLRALSNDITSLESSLARLLSLSLFLGWLVWWVQRGRALTLL